MSEELAYADYNIAEIRRLRQQLAAAECAYALAASHAAAALAWLERYGALLPAAWRDELREALNP